MSLIIDILIIGIILLCIILGYKKGLVGVAFSLISFLAAIVLAILLFIPVSNFIIEKTMLDETIKEAIVENFTSSEQQENTEESNNLPEMMNQSIEKYVNDTKDASIQMIANDLSISIVKFLSFIGIVIVSKIALMFVKAFANLVAKLPLIKQFNKAGGTIFGIVQGFLIVYIILGIATLLAPVLGDASLYSAIEESILGSILYNHNILLKFIF